MKTTLNTLAMTLLILAYGGESRAGYVVNITQSGGDVVATGSGTLEIIGLTPSGVNFATSSSVNGAMAFLEIGDLNHGGMIGADSYNGVSGPATFGDPTGLGYIGADATTGDFVGVGFGLQLVTPHDYVSGSQLSSSSTWNGQTFESLGLTLGTYTWTWGDGAHTDFFTLNIGGTSAVPEPSSFVTLGLGAVGLAGLCWKRRHSKRS